MDHTKQTPSLSQIRETRENLAPYIIETPVFHWHHQELLAALDEPADIDKPTEVFIKLELWQHTGSFKPRGALAVMSALDSQTLAQGVTAVSAGNHAIAVAFAAQLLGSTAKVVMPKTADPFRIQKCRAYGAEVLLADDVAQAFSWAQEIEKDEGRFFVHPFENEQTILGTATVGLEFCEQVADLDAAIIPIGGGGLCAGMATAIKLLQPNCTVFGVEPRGADSMHRSFAAGSPQSIEQVTTIADSLGAPYALPYSFGLCQRFVDELVYVDDDELRQAMLLLVRSMKLMVEPAGAASTAALCGPLRDRLRGQRVGIIGCGANTDVAKFAELVGG